MSSVARWSIPDGFLERLTGRFGRRTMRSKRPHTYIISGLALVAIGGGIYGGVVLTSGSSSHPYSAPRVGISPTTSAAPPPATQPTPRAPAQFPPAGAPSPITPLGAPAGVANAAPAPSTTVPAPAPPPASAPASTIPPQPASGIPQGGGGDGDPDNNGAPSDGDGNR
jgi:hypothetical protein